MSTDLTLPEASGDELRAHTSDADHPGGGGA